MNFFSALAERISDESDTETRVLAGLWIMLIGCATVALGVSVKLWFGLPLNW